jgi:hypothetical protein
MRNVGMLMLILLVAEAVGYDLDLLWYSQTLLQHRIMVRSR